MHFLHRIVLKGEVSAFPSGKVNHLRKQSSNPSAIKNPEAKNVKMTPFLLIVNLTMSNPFLWYWDWDSLYFVVVL